MNLAVVLYLVAAILAVIGAVANPSRVSLLHLAVAFVAAGLAAEILT